ncbi:MAG: mercury(II) reductase [Gemmatimonadaceae bacterium]|nr:mercury(II) reductase [Gemmatimonadaceae bacterium]
MFSGTVFMAGSTIKLNVQGMTCLDCSRHITQALEKVPGVSATRVDYRAGVAEVEATQSVPPASLITAVERAGYKATVASTGAPVEPAPPSPKSPPAESNGEPLTAGDADFDLLIIGTGGAGVAAAIQAVGMGGKVAIVESNTLGGTCVNVGCIPSKNLIEAASHYQAARQGFPGIAPCAPALEWNGVLDSKNSLVAELRQSKYADVIASYPGLALIEGRARFTGGGNGSPVVVAVGEGKGSRTYRARKVLIATGTRPWAPPIPGLDAVGALNSTTVMELTELPASLLVLGGSAVGLELGQTFARFGVKVTIVELAPRLLPVEDESISGELEEHLRADGLEIHTGIETTRADRNGDEVVLHVKKGGLKGTFRAASLLVAVGRRANTDDLGLDTVGVPLTNRGFVEVAATMRTSNTDIFSAGDVTGGPGYVYVAAAGGRIAAENAMKSLASTGTSSDDRRELDLSTVPNVTFTSPQVGSVGLTEAKARELGHHVQVAVLRLDQVPRALVSGDTRGIVKMVADTASGKLLGIHAVAPVAGELMGEAAMAIRFGLTARDVAGTLHPYLTWAESLKLAAQGFTMDISKLSCCA